MLMVVRVDHTLAPGQVSLASAQGRAPGTFMCSPKATVAGSVLCSDAEVQRVLEEFSDVFAELPPGLPPSRDVGHTIQLEVGARPTFRPQFRLSPAEEAEVRRQVADLLAKGFIEPSCSPFGAPVLFVQKKDGSLRMCIDYRALNKITVRDRYPLPRIDDLFDKLQGCRYFTSLDLQSGYHQIRITPEDVPKTAFHTPTGLFQFKVLCFGLTNAPATFQRVMNQVFAPYIGKCVLVYLDDILIMSRTLEEHAQHLRMVLTELRKHKFYAKLSKCEFAREQLKFLGHIISGDGISVDPAKTAVVQQWPRPRNLVQLQGFLGLANYFRRFIQGYSSLVAPLTALTSKAAQSFNWEAWSPATLQAFEGVKRALTSPPVLALPNFLLPFEVRTDACVNGSGGVLLQNGRVIAYTSKKFTPAETRYTTGEQECLALIHALREWRCYLEGAEVHLVTDHHPLIYLQTQATLSRRVARWVEYLQRFDFRLTYSPGVGNVADPLSRWSAEVQAAVVQVGVTTRAGSGARSPSGAAAAPRGATTGPAGQTAGSTPESKVGSGSQLPRRGGNRGRMGGSARHERVGGMGHRVDGMGRQQPAPAEPVLPAVDPAALSGVAPLSETLVTDLLAAYAAEPRFADAEFTAGLSQDEQGLWRLHTDQVLVPWQCKDLVQSILYECHDANVAGHQGVVRTLDLVLRTFWWPTVRRDVKDYVASCEQCQTNKSSNQRPAGMLQPLAVPNYRWESVSVDFVVKLPPSNGYDSICVVVDRLSKMTHFVPCCEAMDAAKLLVCLCRMLCGCMASLLRSSLTGPGCSLASFGLPCAPCWALSAGSRLLIIHSRMGKRSA
jgi:hypothetical protein